MTKEIDIEWLGGLRRDLRQFIAQRIKAQHRTRERAQPAGVGYSDGQAAALHPRHRGLNDRQRDAEKSLQSRHRVRHPSNKYPCKIIYVVKNRKE